MRVRCPDSDRSYRIDGRATIGCAPDADISIADPSLAPRHAILVASGSQPSAWYVISTRDDDEVNGRPQPAGIARLGGSAFSTRLRLGLTTLECEHAPQLRRMEATAVESAARCPRCARPIAAGEALVRCDCGAVAHAACSEGACHRCGAREETEEIDAE
jgi:hypothetical protein